MWEFLGLAQLDIQISPALNNFWSPKWHDFLLCGRLILLALLRDPHSLGLGAQPLGGNLSPPHLGLGLRSRRMWVPSASCMATFSGALLRTWVGVSVRHKVYGKGASETGGSLALAQVDIQISPTLNPF